MRTVMPISKSTYEKCVTQLATGDSPELPCRKCGELVTPFYAECCWFCCHAGNPGFGTYGFLKTQGQQALQQAAEDKAKLEAWVGRDVEFRTNATVAASPFERGVVLKVADGQKIGLRFYIRSRVTGKQFLRQPEHVRLANTEAADVLQPTA